MGAAIARLNQAVSDISATYDGVRPVEQGEGDSFVAAFARASDPVAAALELQRAPLTPAEREVVRLVSGGLGNSDIATGLFVSPRTVQSHLTHVCTKLGLTSRLQLAREAARHAQAT
ncbi:helix-turn-helix transcriptional regulator [Mycobacterium montefiorense]|nr:helix-turn-helix transcriptional regulator [Mycobacterium montefiorense]